jgi:hypothetical protein
MKRTERERVFTMGYTHEKERDAFDLSDSVPCATGSWSSAGDCTEV